MIEKSEIDVKKLNEIKIIVQTNLFSGTFLSKFNLIYIKRIINPVFVLYLNTEKPFVDFLKTVNHKFIH